MQTQSTELNFEGQNLFVGIDVHLKSWVVSIVTDHLMRKTFTQPASAKQRLTQFSEYQRTIVVCVE